MTLMCDNEKSPNWILENGVLLEKPIQTEEKHSYLQEYITTSIAAIGMLICGIHYAWIGPILPALLNGSFKIHITMEQSVWVIALLQVGAVPGSILGSIFANRYGRRIAILLIALPFIASGIITTIAQNVLHYYIARFIGGVAVGMCYSVISMYISEIASPQIRGLLGTALYLSCSIGILFAFILGAYVPIVTYSAICALFPFAMLIISFYLPETPYYYVIQDDLNGAEKSLKFLRRKSFVRDELKRLVEGFKEENAEGKQTFWDLFRDRTNRRSLFVICVLLIAQQWTGASAIFGYSQVIFEEGHSSVSPETCGILLSLMNFAVVGLYGALIDRVGRRKLLIISTIVTIVPLAMLGGYFYLQDVVKYKYIEYLRLTPLFAIVLFKFSFGIGISSLPYVFLGELFPTSVKAYAASFVSVYASFIGVAASKMYEMVYTRYSYPPAFAMFIVWMLLALVFMYFMVPETKGLTLEEIQVHLRKSSKKPQKTNRKG